MTTTIAPDRIGGNDVVLDVRRHRGKEQIRGAVRYDPAKLLDAPRLRLPLPHDGTIVLCADDERIAEHVATRLADEGFGDVCVLEGGMHAWNARGLPTEAPTQEQPIPDDPSAGIHRL